MPICTKRWVLKMTPIRQYKSILDLFKHSYM